MNIVGYGGGTNSTAMLIGLYHRKIPVDLILFSNTGGEQPHTYDFLPIMDRWLEEHGLPTITQVEYTDRNGDRLTLEQECLRSGTLPAIAYGYKKCSLKHKIQPQDKFCNNYPPCREVWARGERVVKFIGFDIGEQKRRDHAQPIDDADTKYKKEKLPYCTVSIELSGILLVLEYKSRYLKVIGLKNAIDNSFSTFSSGCSGGLYEKLNRFK